MTNPVTDARADADGSVIGGLFHRLHNQLGVVLAHAELLEAKAADATSQARAAEVVDATLQTMSLVRELRQHVQL